MSVKKYDKDQKGTNEKEFVKMVDHVTSGMVFDDFTQFWVEDHSQ